VKIFNVVLAHFLLGKQDTVIFCPSARRLTDRSYLGLIGSLWFKYLNYIEKILGIELGIVQRGLKNFTQYWDIGIDSLNFKLNKVRKTIIDTLQITVLTVSFSELYNS
jgi:hypothetical protein